jgi:hypothetical protein
LPPNLKVTVYNKSIVNDLHKVVVGVEKDSYLVKTPHQGAYLQTRYKGVWYWTSDMRIWDKGGSIDPKLLFNGYVNSMQQNLSSIFCNHSPGQEILCLLWK